MTERQSRTGIRGYRSRAEAAQLATEFRTSGLTRREFSEQHRVALNTLNRYISRYSGERADKPRLLRVEVTKPVCSNESGVAVLLACGRRVELAKGFDAATLAEAVRVLDRM
jgi:hypothetical protein